MTVPAPRRVVFARGQWWGGVPFIVELCMVGTIIALVLMASLGEFGWFVLFLIGLCGPIAAGTIIAADWALRAGRVSYDVEGQRVFARRGRRVLASFDISDFDEVAIRERLTWANTLWKGSSFSPFFFNLQGLPYLEATKTINRWEQERIVFPPILIWGKKSCDAAEATLRGELSRSGAEQN
ncbi:hypothetical protein [Aeromicrobium duanguangcaii]|uniref:PH domain-containing protein n=1 Tax=Aeromicrobium duanguangcaii TaxID=2968086 RepID=A0ABY5KLG2_9ACTN|nr:hypothetical protein [Aeromicrobium duanguangcaii]MCD9153764.1 hypothetical protein [Aeromicrobium duanguangcaii]UUI69158.1 hypothetical protein NP095_03355 [Aeromicrobium duanguangcaii]